MPSSIVPPCAGDEAVDQQFRLVAEQDAGVALEPQVGKAVSACFDRVLVHDRRAGRQAFRLVCAQSADRAADIGRLADDAACTRRTGAERACKESEAGEEHAARKETIGAIPSSSIHPPVHKGSCRRIITRFDKALQSASVAAKHHFAPRFLFHAATGAVSHGTNKPGDTS